MKRLLRKLFFDPAWSIGYREIQTDNLPYPRDGTTYVTIPAKRTEWYADPFLFEKDNTTYLFAEIKKIWSGKAVLGVSILKNGIFGPFQVCLDEPFHLSYPNVFSFGDKIYMIPETTRVHQLRIYKADSFPYQWSLEAVLKDNVDFADCSLLLDNDKMFLIGLDTAEAPFKTRVFSLNLEQMNIVEVDSVGALDIRPGGNVLWSAGKRVRPLQDCTNEYGNHLVFSAISQTVPFREDALYELYSKDVITVGDRNNYSRIHTLNRSSRVEVVDLGFNKFYFTKALRRLFLKIKRWT